MTISQFFARALDRYSERIAIGNTREQLGEPNQISYNQLGTSVASLARGLVSLGVSKGDRVAIISRPRIRFVEAFLAILQIGAVAVPLDPTFTKEEIKKIIDETQIDIVFAPQHLAERLPADRARLVNLDDGSAGTKFTSLLKQDTSSPSPTIEESDLAVLAYTSGTTGGPKGVMLTHRNITADIEACLEVMPITEQDVFLTIAPWHHILGLTTALLLPLYTGAFTLYTDDYRSIADLLYKYSVTIFTGVPKLYHAMYKKLLAQIEGTISGRIFYKLVPRLVGNKIKDKLTGGSLRFFVSGSAPLAPAVSLGFRQLGIGMLEGYGLTETSPVISFCSPFSSKGGSVGKPLPTIETKLANLRPDGVGELLVRGPTVMSGYYRNEEATAQVIDKDGWFHTGDLVSIDKDGEIFLKGRVKNVVVLENGKNVYPEEIEWEIARIPYVEEVLVQGCHRQGREVVEVVVYPNYEQLEQDGHQEEVKKTIWKAIMHRQKRLAPHKRIRRQDYVSIVDHEFPKTSTMDIQRHLYKGDDNAFNY